jgi:hypothetical protein
MIGQESLRIVRNEGLLIESRLTWTKVLRRKIRIPSTYTSNVKKLIISYNYNTNEIFLRSSTTLTIVMHAFLEK